VKSGGFDLGETSLATGSSETEWEGLSGVILKQEGWFGQWVDGERKCMSPLLSSCFLLFLYSIPHLDRYGMLMNSRREPD
jgi:hypothetical protein